VRETTFFKDARKVRILFHKLYICIYIRTKITRLKSPTQNLHATVNSPVNRVTLKKENLSRLVVACQICQISTHKLVEERFEGIGKKNGFSLYPVSECR